MMYRCTHTYVHNCLLGLEVNMHIAPMSLPAFEIIPCRRHPNSTFSRPNVANLKEEITSQHLLLRALADVHVLRFTQSDTLRLKRLCQTLLMLPDESGPKRYASGLQAENRAQCVPAKHKRSYVAVECYTPP